MNVATKAQIKSLVRNGDEKVAIAGMNAAQSISNIMNDWGNMNVWEIEYAAKTLRELLEIVEG